MTVKQRCSSRNPLQITKYKEAELQVNDLVSFLELLTMNPGSPFGPMSPFSACKKQAKQKKQSAVLRETVKTI